MSLVLESPGNWSLRSCKVLEFTCDSNYTIGIEEKKRIYYRVPTLPGKSWKVLDFSPKISRPLKVLENEFGPGKSWKWKFEVLESAGIYLWFKLYNRHSALYRTACVSKYTKYSCWVASLTLSFQLAMNVPRYVRGLYCKRCIFWVSNCRLTLYFNIAVLRQLPGKTFWGPGKSWRSRGIFWN